MCTTLRDNAIVLQDGCRSVHVGFVPCSQAWVNAEKYATCVLCAPLCNALRFCAPLCDAPRLFRRESIASYRDRCNCDMLWSCGNAMLSAQGKSLRSPTAYNRSTHYGDAKGSLCIDGFDFSSQDQGRNVCKAMCTPLNWGTVRNSKTVCVLSMLCALEGLHALCVAVRPCAAQKPCRDLFSLAKEASDRFDEALVRFN